VYLYIDGSSVSLSISLHVLAFARFFIFCWLIIDVVVSSASVFFFLWTCHVYTRICRYIHVHTHTHTHTHIYACTTTTRAWLFSLIFIRLFYQRVCVSLAETKWNSTFFASDYSTFDEKPSTKMEKKK
jgi:hypothetical protein